MAQGNTQTERQTEIQSGREQRPASAGRGLARTGYSGPVASGNPFSLLQRMSDDMDRLFEHLAFGPRLGTGRALQRSWLDDFWGGGEQQALWSPPLEMFQRGDSIVVRAELPGLRKEDINVDVDSGVLTISGERKHEHEENREGFYRSERSYGRFHRSVQLPEGVDGEQVEATFRDGVLEVQVPAPKQETRKARKIQIR